MLHTLRPNYEAQTALSEMSVNKLMIGMLPCTPLDLLSILPSAFVWFLTNRLPSPLASGYVEPRKTRRKERRT